MQKIMFSICKLALVLTLVAISAHGYSTEIPLFQSQVDSLIVQLNTQTDSNRIKTLLKLTWQTRNFNPEQSVKYGLEAIELSKSYNDFENLAKAYGFVGVAYRVLGNYSKSIDFYHNGLEVAKAHGLSEQEGFAYLNLANLHIYQEYFTSAIENIRKAEAIAVRTGSQTMLAYVHLYAGRAYLIRKEYDTALTFFHKALALRKSMDNFSEQADCYKYIGDIYFEKKQYASAIKNYDLAHGLMNLDTDKNLLANLLVKKAMVYYHENQNELAAKLAMESLSLANQIGASLVIRDGSSVMANISLQRNDFKSASQYLKSVISFNHELFGQQLSEKIFYLEYQLEKQQREMKIEVLNKDNTIKMLELNRARSFNFTLSISLVFVVILFGMTLVLLKIRRKRTELLETQNQEIEKQRMSIEQKNQHLQNAYSVIEGYIGSITDSIQYAKKIQEAILPNLSILKPYFSDSFCLYLPKDFVSGDFYWFSQKNDKLIVALADCTGHGVPGAFMSIIGMDLLSQAVNQHNLTEPSQILNYLSVELRNKLRKNDEEEAVLKDSMDIAIVSMNMSSNKLTYSGALIPLTIIRDRKVFHYKPYFTSIGVSKSILNKPFEQQEVELLPNDWIYLYSDGYMDQFGGEQRKKFMRSRFVDTLNVSPSSSGEERKETLTQVFNKWKGNNEQIDDVLVLGLKF